MIASCAYVAVMRFGLPVLAFLMICAAPVAAQEEGASMRSFSVIRLLERPEYVGPPAVCPGSSPQDDPTRVICTASLYQARVSLARLLGDEEIERRFTLRFTASAEWINWVRGTKALVATRPFEDKGTEGHFAYWWNWENQEGRFCEGEEFVAKSPAPLRDFYREGKVITAPEDDEEWSAGYSYVCVRAPG